MRTMSATLFSLIVTASQAYAASGANGGEDLDLLAIGFILFGVLILLFQFVPALLLVGGMIGATFKKSEKNNKIGLVCVDKIA